MAKQVIWSKLAHQDRKSILEYWIRHNISDLYSNRLNQIFENTVDLISKHPKIGKKTEVQDIRIKIIKNYFLTYRETPTTIEILTIWDSRQDPINFVRILQK
jgi:toxin YoeB